MKLSQVKYFIAVAEELHFSRAADRVRIAQSPLSRAIRGLEDELGVLLLERNTQGTKLTRPGEVFLYHARLIVAATETAKRAVVSADRKPLGSASATLRSDFLVAPSLTSEIPDRDR